MTTRKAVTPITCLMAGILCMSAAPAIAGSIPSGGPPSALFGATPFSQPMPIFEEFGTRPMPTTACSNCTPVPVPTSCNDGPSTTSLDAFLQQQPLVVMPMIVANKSTNNPGLPQITKCLPKVKYSPAEGRPSGVWYAHQRWDEFQPREYFVTSIAPGRINTGMRDTWQRHRFATGEFGPGGLYHGKDKKAGTNKSDELARFHPLMPLQTGNAVWTFDGTLPPKLLMTRVGVPTLLRHYNLLPINVSANGGFGRHTISTHHHNGHNPAESDGYPAAFFFPGQYYDYRWPMALAGYDSINEYAENPRAGYPDGNGGIVRIRGDWKETMSTHWFHDHMEEHTSENVYKGMAAMMNIYSAVDRGQEGFQCHYANPANPNLCLPSGTDLDWGNRDYDVNLVVADKAWDAKGQLWFNIFERDGFLGDRVLVNWAWKPQLKVRARRYRLRILNGSVARYFKFAIVNAAGQRVPYHIVANDGNLMEHAVRFPNAQSQDLPPQAIAEWFDVVIDFKPYAPGSKLYMVNLMEHADGRGPKRILSLAEALSPAYDGDPGVGKFLEFQVEPYAGKDLSMNPADYEEGGLKMVPLPEIKPEELATARVREFEFGRSGGSDGFPWSIKVDGGQGLTWQPERISAAPQVGSVEIWRIRNGGNGWAHPIHSHFEEGRILSRDGAPPPIWEKWARKDVFRVGSESTGDSREVEMAIRVREFQGSFVQHCHTTTHEDYAMMLRWDATQPGGTVLVPTPIQTWQGTKYVNSIRLTKGN